METLLAKLTAISMDSWMKMITKVGFPVAVAVYLLRFVVGGLSAQITQTNAMLMQHQEQMVINNQAQQIYLYQMCVSMAVTSGRAAAACPQPAIK